MKKSIFHKKFNIQQKIQYSTKIFNIRQKIQRSTKNIQLIKIGTLLSSIPVLSNGKNMAALTEVNEI